MIELIGMFFVVFAGYVGFVLAFWALASAALAVGVAGTCALHWVLTAFCEMGAVHAGCSVVGSCGLRFWRSGECRRCKLSRQRTEQAARRALTAAPVFMRICAGVLSVLGIVTITMHWPWVLVVAIVVWHLWPTRKPRLV